MATGPDPSRLGLSEDDLGELHSALYPARNSYKSFGLQIAVKMEEIKIIEGKCIDIMDTGSLKYCQPV